MGLREYQERLIELSQEGFDQLYLNTPDPPWHVITPSYSDPMGPKTCLVESLNQLLPSNIFPKDLRTGWKDADHR